MIFTSCKDCVFAKYENITQTGCKLNRIEKFQKKSFGKVIEAYDDDREFYILDDLKCNAYTTKTFVNEFNIYDYLKIPILFLIYQDKHNTIDELNQLIESAYNTKYSKLKVSVRYNGDIKRFAKHTLKTIDLVEDKRTISYDYTLDPQLSFAAQINNSIEKDKSHGFYVIARSGEYQLDESLFNRINKVINIHLENFAMILPYQDRYNGLVVNTQYHKYCLGFGDFNDVIKKADQMLSEEDYKRLVWTQEKFNGFK